jgi:hypothetical protein
VVGVESIGVEQAALGVGEGVDPVLDQDGADGAGGRVERGDREHFYVQLVCEGGPYQKPKNYFGPGTIGVDPGPRVFAFASADWAVRVDLGQEPNQRKIQCLQRTVERRRHKGNPANYLPAGRIKPGQKR